MMRHGTRHPQPGGRSRAHQARADARAGRLWRTRCLLSASLAVGLIALELVLGLTHYRDLTRPSTDYPPGYFVADPELGADLGTSRPPATFRMRGPLFEVFTNRWGCFDHDDPIGDGYVLAVGDSSTWGYAPPGDRWTDHLETLSGRRILKCGVSGTGPRYQQIKARKTIAKVGMAPDVILVLYDTWNDLNDDAVFPGYGVVDGYRGHTLKSLDLRTGALTCHTPEAFERRYRRFLARQEAFSLARFLTEHLTIAAMIGHVLTERLATRRPPARSWSDATTSPCGTSTPRATRGWFEAFEQHLDNIRALRRDGRDARRDAGPDHRRYPGPGVARRGFGQFLASEIPYHLDVAGPMAQAAHGRRTRYHHDPHWNALGNRLAAEIIHRYLREAGLL